MSTNMPKSFKCVCTLHGSTKILNKAVESMAHISWQLSLDR